MQGVFVTGVPEADVAAVRLGSRVICPGDVLPVSALSSLTLHPACEGGRDAVLTYSPICGTRLDPEATLTIRIKSGKNETPKAIAAEFETYKNIANDGQLTTSRTCGKRSKKPAPICWATHPATTANELGTRRVSYLMRPSAARSSWRKTAHLSTRRPKTRLGTTASPSP